jgi:hypothetical protein
MLQSSSASFRCSNVVTQLLYLINIPDVFDCVGYMLAGDQVVKESLVAVFSLTSHPSPLTGESSSYFNHLVSGSVLSVITTGGWMQNWKS